MPNAQNHRCRFLQNTVFAKYTGQQYFLQDQSHSSRQSASPASGVVLARLLRAARRRPVVKPHLLASRGRARHLSQRYGATRENVPAGAPEGVRRELEA